MGKSSTAAAVADRLDRSAVVDVDDIRQLVRSGHAAPWDGDEGLAQQHLGVENACALAARLHDAGFVVVVADVLTAATLELYRSRLPGCLVLRLFADDAALAERAASRAVHLTKAEFDRLHADDRSRPVAADLHVDVGRMGPEEQAAAVLAAWRGIG